MRLLGIPSSRVSVVTLGFVPPVIEAFDATPTDGPYLLCVSSSQYPYKNLIRLFEAYLRVVRKFPHKLIVVGKRVPRFAQEIEARIVDLGLAYRILLMENLSDREMAALYRNADAFVYPSLYEGFGIPVLEAYGIPVVASDAASIPEVCGNAAYYIDPLSVESLAEGIVTVLTDGALRERLRQAGFERVKQFSWQRTAQEILNACESVTSA
jgi:glycosyltransferase involved in cell wall biosynthesis